MTGPDSKKSRISKWVLKRRGLIRPLLSGIVILLTTNFQQSEKGIAPRFHNISVPGSTDTPDQKVTAGADTIQLPKTGAPLPGTDPLTWDGPLDVLMREGIHRFLDRRIEPVDLIDEQHIAFVQLGEDTRQIPLLFNGGTAGGVQGASHGEGNDIGKGGFSQTRGPTEQEMVQSFRPSLGGLYKYLQVLLDLNLPRILLKGLRPQGRFEELVFTIRHWCYWSFRTHGLFTQQ